MKSPKVWFITGCSSGFGRELAILARKRGDFVIATARKVETLNDLKELGCEVMTVDVTSSEDTVKRTIDQAHAIHGRIDILVNNAGFNIVGPVEETNDKDLLTLFDTNVFGQLRVTRAVLPYMRAIKSGTIAFIGSSAGYLAIPVNGVYGSTKFAIAGLSQSLAQEVAPFGIEVTVVEPGMFSTSITSNMRVLPNPIDDYAPLKKTFDEMVKAGVGVPSQDPVKGAQAIIEALTKTVVVRVVHCLVVCLWVEMWEPLWMANLLFVPRKRPSGSSSPSLMPSYSIHKGRFRGDVSPSDQ